jgi:uncharacterized membrane protein YqjE
MAGETMRFRNPAGHAGLLHNLLSLLNSVAGFLEARIALVHVLVLVGCLAAAAFLAVFGYIFLAASAIVALGHALHISWVKMALMAAGLHFVLAFICVMIARSRMNKSMFEMTGAELKKDREWLKNLDKESRSTH